MAKKSVKQQCEALALLHNWTVEDDNDGRTFGRIWLDCPPGKILDGDLHTRVIPYDSVDERNKAWTEAMEEITRGEAGALEDCTPENQACHGAGCFMKDKS